MSLKKMMCLLLALMMVFTIAACGDDEGSEGSSGDKTANGENTPEGSKPFDEPPATEPSVEELGPWIVTEEVDSYGNVFHYQYDEHGELTGYALYDEDGKKLRDYKVAHSMTETGGKLITVESKHVKDSAYAKDNEMEYDVSGNLIRKSEFVGNKITSTRYYTYDHDGNLLNYKVIRSGDLSEEASYTYANGVLATASGRMYVGESVYPYDYSYSYGENGYLNEISFDVSGVGEGTITLEKNTHNSEGGLHVLTHSAHSMAYQNLFSYEAELDEDGQRSKFTIRFRRWGFQAFYSLPIPGYGSRLSGWEECEGSITYTRLDVYLEQNA